MISSGTNESSTSRDTDSVVRIKHNYTKFSTTEAPFCIELHRCGSTLNVWKQKGWWAVSVSSMHIDKMKRSRTVLVFTLTSSTISKCIKMQILFLHKSSLVKVIWLLQSKNKNNFGSFANLRVLKFSSNFKRKSGCGKSAVWAKAKWFSLLQTVLSGLHQGANIFKKSMYKES